MSKNILNNTKNIKIITFFLNVQKYFKQVFKKYFKKALRKFNMTKKIILMAKSKFFGFFSVTWY